MGQSTLIKRPFLERANDLECRDFSARFSRFLRGSAHHWCSAITLFADDPRVITAWRRGWDVSHYLRLLRWRDSGFSPRVIYDIGAHDGRWSEMAQNIFGEAKILLFEPQLELQKRAMLRQPAGAAWEMMPVALGDHEGKSLFHVTTNSAASSLLAPVDGGAANKVWGTGSHRADEVIVARLDTLAASRSLPTPDLIKIDVQGYEGPLLAGGQDVVSKAHRLVVEVSLQTMYRGQVLMPEVLNLLTVLGFQLEDISDACRAWPGVVSQVDLWLKR